MTSRQRTISCPAPYIPSKFTLLKKQQQARDEETEQDRAMLNFAQKHSKTDPIPCKPITSTGASAPSVKQKPKGPLSLDLSPVLNQPESAQSVRARTESMSARDILIRRQKTALDSYVSDHKSHSGAESARI